MLLQVQPSDRFEGPRAAYAAAKRPLAVPSGRSVNPRLEQELPTDAVKGLGRRKIPTSSQHPTRGTNVPIVYSRLSAPRSIGQKSLQNGDVIFVGKSNTVFGAGTGRFTRCASLDDINAMLRLDTNVLSDTNVQQAPLLQTSRKVLENGYTKGVVHERQEMGIVRAAKQTPSYESQMSLAVMRTAFAQASAALNDAEDDVRLGQATPVWPEFDWLSLPALTHWNIDGVLFGQEVDDTILNAVIPNPEDGDRLLNVCVEGPCPVRNQLSAVPQFFDDGAEPGGFLYVCLVAYSTHGVDWWKFELKPVSSRQINCLDLANASDHSAPARPGGKANKFTVENLVNTVAAWRLGRVVDDKLNSGQHGRVLLDVDIVLMDRVAFLRHVLGDEEFYNSGLPLGRIVRPPPPPVAIPPVAGGGGGGGGGGEIIVGGDQDGGNATFMRMLLTIPAAFALFAARLEESTYETLAFNFGRAARIAGTSGWFNASSASGKQVYPLTPRWLSQPHHNFANAINGAVVVATQTYTLRTLASRSRDYQSQWACNALYLTQAGLPAAIDKFMLTAGPSIVDYDDICWLFSLMRDGGLTHALCTALKNAKIAGVRLFPYEVKTSRVNSNARVGMISFKLPPQRDGMLHMEGLLEMGPFLEMSLGKTWQQKVRRVSFSLNLLFDLPMNTQWSFSDTRGWTRPVTDNAVWDVGSESRLGYLTDLSQNALTTGNDFQSTNFLTLVVSIGLLAPTAMSPATYRATLNETKGAGTGAFRPPDTGNVTTFRETAYGSGILQSVSGDGWTPAVSSNPFVLAPANFSGSRDPVPVPQRASGVANLNNQQLRDLAAQRPDLFVFAAGGNATVGDAVASGVHSFGQMVYDGAIGLGRGAGNLMWDMSSLGASLGAAEYDLYGPGPGMYGTNRRPLA